MFFLDLRILITPLVSLNSSYIINEGGVLNLYYVIIICEHIKIKSLENSWTKVSFLVFSKTNIDIWKMYRRPDPTYKPNTPPEESNSCMSTGRL